MLMPRQGFARPWHVDHSLTMHMFILYNAHLITEIVQVKANSLML